MKGTTTGACTKVLKQIFHKSLGLTFKKEKTTYKRMFSDWQIQCLYHPTISLWLEPQNKACSNFYWKYIFPEQQCAVFPCRNVVRFKPLILLLSTRLQLDSTKNCLKFPYIRRILKGYCTIHSMRQGFLFKEEIIIYRASLYTHSHCNLHEEHRAQNLNVL